jgi:hypothetical protein
VQKLIADSGPLIALFDTSDNDHPRLKDFFASCNAVVMTTWPVVTEVCHMLSYSVNRQLAFLKWIQRGALDIADLPANAIAEMIVLTEKYRDRPMDLADASLVVLSMQTGIRNIISLDSDFDIYRLPDKSRLKNLLRLPT